MNASAFCSLSYGMYVVATELGGKLNGQIANVGGQLTNDPPRIGICLSKKTLTGEMIGKRGAFTLSILSEKAPMVYIGKFGFRSGRDINKFTDTKYVTSKKMNLPIVTEYTVSYIEAVVEQKIDVDPYCFLIGLVVDADVLHADTPMTYAYYHFVKGGKTQQNAPTYMKGACEVTPRKSTQTQEKSKYHCKECKYVYNPEQGDQESNIPPGVPFEKLPEDWQCPLCGAPKAGFVIIV